jgi:TetR/AcrR family transcriptional repressor of nem operon
MARSKDFDEQDVLSKAVNLFWLKGYNGTSMQDLVDTLGISRSSLYDTYGDKHSLYVKALERYQYAGNDQMCSIINNAPSARDAIKQLLQFIANNLTQKGCFLVNAEVEVAPHDEVIGKMICQKDQQLEDIFYEAIKRGQDKGDLNGQQDARALARFVSNAVKGMQVTAKSTTDRRIFDDIINLTVKVLG